MNRTLPTREELMNKLESLCSGAEARSDVASWAIAFIVADDLQVTDRVAWKVLKQLGAVDLIAPDRPYLYGVEDFRAWQAELVPNPSFQRTAAPPLN